jgi:uncharacterized protein with von Willebrand factor type A (vWA) domain
MAAELIIVTRQGDDVTVDVDGTVIPGEVLETGSVNVPVDPERTPRVELVLKARRVEVVNDESPEPVS